MARKSECIWRALDLRASIEVSVDGVEIIAPFYVTVKQEVTADRLVVTFARRTGLTVPDPASEILAKTTFKPKETNVFLDWPSLETAIESRTCLCKVTVH